ncbi:hypothetical protein AMETH_3865 [Amycolatopsis methanolica 239]|uniref:Uncharacterized protein n=1 Tax=Amycolatopsis methanolica 239 TaxID=1068978 RepID=A0A076N1W7_AMYME|nr:hypothetical protein AMETH_3865 [Amycolatopsis methanolica 239]
MSGMDPWLLETPRIGTVRRRRCSSASRFLRADSAASR